MTCVQKAKLNEEEVWDRNQVIIEGKEKYSKNARHLGNNLASCQQFQVR